MSTNDENFKITGPSYLAAVDWGNSNHRRVVMASLVQGVYVQQSDQGRGRRALAPPWWESFHFTLKEALHDKKDNSIFGSIYELNTSSVASKSPKFVVAFRGTQNCRDLKLDKDILTNELKKNSRVKQALESVTGLLTSPVGASTWLGGHSLGAAIALLVGKELAKHKRRLETYLFNPPIVSIPINLFIDDEKIKKLTRALTTVGRFLANIITSSDFLRGPDPFDAIREWMPHLYVNPSDPFCCEYISYFENRKTMRKHGLETVERIANQVSFRRNEAELEPMHLLASAELTINKKRHSCVFQAHAIRHWWINLELDSPTLYQY